MGPIYVSDKVYLSNADIAAAEGTDWQGKPVISFQTTPNGGVRMRAFTRQHINERAAMFINGKMVSAPMIKGEISERGMIVGNFTAEEAREIARGLAAGGR